jgi:hypothetical protein
VAIAPDHTEFLHWYATFLYKLHRHLPMRRNDSRRDGRRTLTLSGPSVDRPPQGEGVTYSEASAVTEALSDWLSGLPQRTSQESGCPICYILQGPRALSAPSLPRDEDTGI